MALSGEIDNIETLINHSLRIKKEYIEDDEFDTDKRLILNYGHSFGHAIEAASQYQIPHGIAVAHGMDMANYLSLRKGYIDDELYNYLRKILESIWSDIIPKEINCEDYISLLRLDKKSIGQDLRLILTKGIGRMFIEKIKIDDDFIRLIDLYIESNFNS